ncbi:hypothetical protein [Gluconobacter kondonii]|nr:hypothetical protein [Gluconobacter kondonii]MBS1079271.1 hypothetical protein [Gluconobacter kondonii]
MSTDLIDVLLPCVLVVALYGAGIITGLVIAKADDWMQGFGRRQVP